MFSLKNIWTILVKSNLVDYKDENVLNKNGKYFGFTALKYFSNFYLND